MMKYGLKQGFLTVFGRMRADAGVDTSVISAYLYRVAEEQTHTINI